MYKQSVQANGLADGLTSTKSLRAYSRALHWFEGGELWREAFSCIVIVDLREALDEQLVHTTSQAHSEDFSKSVGNAIDGRWMSGNADSKSISLVFHPD